MDKRLLGPVGIGLVVVLIGVGAVFYMQRGAHVELKGSMLKIRMAAMDENSSIVVIDFRFANPADYPFVVRTVEVTMDDKQGKQYLGQPVSETDAKRVFEFYPLLGQKYNDTLIMHDKIGPHVSQDRMIAARFECPVARLDARKSFRIRIEDVDGPVSELVEKP